MGITRGSPLYEKLRFRARAMKYARRVDPCEIRLLRRLLDPGDLAIDVGAHKGGYVYWLQRAVTSSGKVLAFEPHGELAEYLRFIKDIFGYSQLEIVECAVSNSAGTRSLFCPSTRVSTGATLVEGLFPENDAVDSVEAVTLDEFLSGRADLELPAYIKIDVETHELEVLQGARRVLETAGPVVQFEADQHVYGERSINEIFDFLASLGFSGFFFFNGTLQSIADFELSVHQPSEYRTTPNYRGFANNFIFVPRERETRLLR